MNHPLQLLLVEEAHYHQYLIEETLSAAGYLPVIHRVETRRALREALDAATFDIILCDAGLPEISCEEALKILESTGLDIPLIALSGSVNEERVLALVRAGARDYVMKNNLARLPAAVRRELCELEGRRQRRRLETHLQQATKMEAIGRLAAGVAHDFNNLLTVITGFAQLALLDENPAREGLEQILRAAERAAGLTRQLLAFSRLQELEPRICDLNQLVRDLEKMLLRLIGEDVQVITRIADEPLNVKIDPGKMEQVVLNLAVNSRDAMRKGGKLILSTSSRRLEGTAASMHGLPDNDYCVISISDSGSGITAEVLPHIFEPFFTTKPEGQGTGLGLSTVYGIVQQSGGAIHAYSEPGVGTTMTVFIPSSAAQSDTGRTAAMESLATGFETVLVAEDDARVLQLVSQCLSARGFAVLEASNGEEALEILDARGATGVDLLITDVVMPVLTGPVLAAKASVLCPELKILFMSGYSEEVIQHHGICDGNVAFLQKPFAPRDLIKRVRHLLDSDHRVGHAGASVVA